MPLKDDSELPVHHGEEKLVCMDCERQLVTIVKIENDGPLHQYQSQCPCGSMSFCKRVAGKVKIAPSPDLPIINIVTNNGKTVFITRNK